MLRAVLIGGGGLLAWLAGASVTLVWALGVWASWPWPSKAWAWIDYAAATLPQASAPLVRQYLWGAAVLAAFPVMGTVVLLIRLQVGSGKQKLYGETKWAEQRDVLRGGMRLRRKL